MTPKKEQIRDAEPISPSGEYGLALKDLSKARPHDDDPETGNISQVQQWRPISEAPNEGVSFLVWAKHRTDNEFSVIQASWFEGRLYADSKESIIDFEDGLQATHWMPLPAAPEREG